MRVFTPNEVATGTESKYLGVLVAAKYARELNSLPREAMPLGEEKKLTAALPAVAPAGPRTTGSPARGGRPCRCARRGTAGSGRGR